MPTAPRQPSPLERVRERRDGPASGLTDPELVAHVAQVAPPPRASARLHRLADEFDDTADLPGPPDPP